MANAERSNLVELASGWDPDWSPDGKSIVFASGALWSGTDIYVMDADGTNPVKLTEGLFADFPSWSPDGSRIAFRSWPPESKSSVRVMNADGSGLQGLAEFPSVRFSIRAKTVFFGIDWSPDGRWIVFQTKDFERTEVWIVGSDGSGLRHAVAANFGSNPKWSPSGQSIAFSAKDGGRLDGIRLLDFAGSDVRRSTKNHPDHNPAWSPDGSKIAYARLDAIYVMDADGSNQRRLAVWDEVCGPSE